LYASSALPLNLNGSRATSRPFAAFPGAIRQDTNFTVGITNIINLQSDSLIHVQGSASGSLTLSGPVSGVGHLEFTAPGESSDSNQGKLVLSNSNTYFGGTIINGGTVMVSTGSGLGTGPLSVNVNIK